MSHSRLGDSWVHICSRGTHLLHIMQPVKCAATMAGTLHCSNVITSLSHYNCAIQTVGTLLPNPPGMVCECEALLKIAQASAECGN